VNTGIILNPAGLICAFAAVFSAYIWLKKPTSTNTTTATTTDPLRLEHREATPRGVHANANAEYKSFESSPFGSRALRFLPPNTPVANAEHGRGLFSP
jgi:hypothetical protein